MNPLLKRDSQVPPNFGDAMKPLRAVFLGNVFLEENASRNTLDFPILFFPVKLGDSKRSHLLRKCGEPLVWNIHHVFVVNSQSTAEMQFAGLFSSFISCKPHCAWNEQKASFLFVCSVSSLFHFYPQICFSLSVLELYSFFQQIFVSSLGKMRHQKECYRPRIVVSMSYRFHLFLPF